MRKSPRRIVPGRISVIVPVFNVEAYVDDCMESLYAQDDTDFEVVVVDDGSSDTSIDRVNRFADRLRHLKIVRQDNRGLGGARNTGMDHASGELITFMDSDDVVSPAYLSSMRIVHASGDFDVVTARLRLASAELKDLGPPREYRAPLLDPPAMPHELVLGTNAPAVSCGRLYRRAILDGFPFPELTPHEDLFFTYKVLRQASSTSTSDQAVYSWRMRSDSLGRSLTQSHVDMLPRLRADTREYLSREAAPIREFVFAARRNLSMLVFFRGKANRAAAGVLDYLHKSIVANAADIDTDIDLYSTLLFPDDAAIKDRLRRLIDEAHAARGARIVPVTSRPAGASHKGDSASIDVAFFPLRAYHYIDARAVSGLIARDGIRSVIVNSDDYRDGRNEVRTTARNAGVDTLSLQEYLGQSVAAKVLVFWNDWDPVMRVVALAGRLARVATVGWVEGVNDYRDVDTGRPRHAYLRSSDVFLPGEFDRRYFGDTGQQIHVGEVLRVGALWRERQSNRRSRRPRRALINSNFSYGVLLAERDQWVRDCVEACIEAGLEPVLSRHPFDLGQEYAEYQTDEPFTEALGTCSVSIQRFGSGVLESLAIGVPVIYFKPRSERIDKYTEPMGAYVIAETRDGLRDVLSQRRYRWSESHARGFLRLHAGVDDSSPPGAAIMHLLRKIVSQSSGRPKPIGPVVGRLVERQDRDALTSFGKEIGPFYGPDAQSVDGYQEVLSRPRRISVDTKARRPIYAPFGDWLEPRSPTLYRSLQLIRRAGADVWRRRKWTLPILVTLVVVGAAGVVIPDGPLQLALIAASIGAAFVFAFAYLSLRTYESVTSLIAEVNSLIARAAATSKRAAENERTVQRIAEEPPARQEALERAIKEEIRSLTERIEVDQAALRQQVGRISETERAELRRWVEAAVKAGDDSVRREFALVTNKLRTLESQSLSLHIATALRMMRPLWIGDSAVEALNAQSEVEHGHELLMAILADEHKDNPGSLAGRTLIEIGTTRENVASQSSTQKLALFTALVGMRFVTVDMDPANTQAVATVLRHLNPTSEAITALGEEFLTAYSGQVDAVYLDAFDIDHQGHSEERRSRYREILMTDITDAACWRMHEACAEALVARMEFGGSVVIDDTWIDEHGDYSGKGKLAVPVLLEHGFKMIARTERAVGLRRIGV